MKRTLIISIFAVSVFFGCNNKQSKMTSDEVESLVAKAYVHTFPIVENYKAIYFYGILEQSPKYMPMNSLKHEQVLYTPEDKFVVSANNDTYYSTGILDLRAEPVIFKVPESKDRYYTFQLVGMTTDNFGYIGVNTTGADAGIYAVTSPNFNGTLPEGVKEIKSPSEFVVVAGRTAVNAENPDDSEKAIALQKKYEVGPIHNFYPDFPVSKVERVEFPELLLTDYDNEQFFSKLNFLMQFNKFTDDEQKILDSYQKIGIKAGEPYDFFAGHPEFQQAIENGISKAKAKIDSMANNMGRRVNGWDLTSTGEYFGKNYTLRTSWAKRGIYVNSPTEAYYPSISVDESGEQLNGLNTYRITFPSDNLPPAKYFWSLTMYHNDSKLMVENDLKRYSIGDRTDGLTFNDDGSLTIYFSNEMPAEGKNNWLPAPAGDFYMLMRLYGPSENVLKNNWTPPAIQRIEK